MAEQSIYGRDKLLRPPLGGVSLVYHEQRIVILQEKSHDFLEFTTAYR